MCSTTLIFVSHLKPWWKRSPCCSGFFSPRFCGELPTSESKKCLQPFFLNSGSSWFTRKFWQKSLELVQTFFFRICCFSEFCVFKNNTISFNSATATLGICSPIYAKHNSFCLKIQQTVSCVPMLYGGVEVIAWIEPVMDDYWYFHGQQWKFLSVPFFSLVMILIRFYYPICIDNKVIFFRAYVLIDIKWHKSCRIS